MNFKTARRTENYTDAENQEPNKSTSAADVLESSASFGHISSALLDQLEPECASKKTNLWLGSQDKANEILPRLMPRMHSKRKMNESLHNMRTYITNTTHDFPTRRFS